MPSYYNSDDESAGRDNYGQGYGSPSSSGGREQFGNTSNFSTTLISDDGRFLGIKLSQDMASQLRTFYPVLLDWTRRKGEKFGIPLAEKFAKNALKHNEHDAAHFAGKAGNIIGYGIILSNQMLDVGRNMYDSMHSLNELRASVRPLATAGNGNAAPLSGNNEVVSNARAKINGVFWQRLKETVTGTIATAPALIIKWNEQKIKNADRETLHAIADAKNDPDKVAEILEKKMTAVQGMEGVGADQLEQGFEKFVTQKREAYEGELQKFIASGDTAKAKEELKKQFVRRHGAFDGNYTGSLETHDRGRPTIRDELKRQFYELRQSQEKLEEEVGTDPHGIGNMAASLGAGIVAELTTKAFGGKGLEKYRQPIALDRILHLRREMEKAGDNPPEQVAGIALDKNRNDKDMGYAQYVHRIFQQHQKDCHRTEIGSRFTEHFDSARWDDEAIQQLPDAQLSSYEYAVKTIAKRIKDGRMDAIALISLVGDKQKKIVHDDGRSFGPRNTKDDAAVKAAILKAIDEQTILLHAGQGKSDQDITEKLGNFVFSIDDLKRALTSTEMDAQHRSFIFTVFSNVVGNDEKLCEMVGISNEHCQKLRAESKERFNALLDGAVATLADMIEKEPEALAQKVQFTDKEKQMIVSLAGRMQEEGKNVADLTANREEIKSLETAVANAAMALDKNAAGRMESNKPQGFWQKLISAARKPKTPAPKAEKPIPAASEMSEEAGMAEHTRGMEQRRGWGSRSTDDTALQEASAVSTVAREATRRTRRDGETTEIGA